MALLDEDYWLGLDAGVAVGYMLGRDFEKARMTAAQINTLQNDSDIGYDDIVFVDGGNIESDGTVMYVSAMTRLDFFAQAKYSLGPILGLGWGYHTIESDYSCNPCTAPPNFQTSTDEARGSFQAHFGVFGQYQFKWFNVGFDLELTYFVNNDDDVLMELAVDFGLNFGIVF